jgi:hypothetical protein
MVKGPTPEGHVGCSSCRFFGSGPTSGVVVPAASYPAFGIDASLQAEAIYHEDWANAGFKST